MKVQIVGGRFLSLCDHNHGKRYDDRGNTIRNYVVSRKQHKIAASRYARRKVNEEIRQQLS